MISRNISGGAICLGCRLRLLSQATRPRYPHAVTRYNAAVASRRQPSRWFSDDQLRARPDEHGQSHDGEHKNPDGSEMDIGTRSKSFYKSDFFATDDSGFDYEQNRGSRRASENEDFTFKRINLNKRHLSRNRLLTEASESLGQDMLGKPAYAIVMKDRGLYKTNRSRAVDLDTATVPVKSSQLEIQALLENQDEPVTPAEVRANIDGLCPESETYLPEKEFRAIQQELAEGFLKSQLGDYIDRFKAALEEATEAEIKAEAETETEEGLESEQNERGLETQTEEFQDHVSSGEADPQGDADSTTRAPTYPWIREISPWVRLNSEEVAAGGLPEKARRAHHARMLGSSHRGTNGGLGQVEVKLRKLEFTMLMRGNRRFLKRINERFLDRGESMDIFVSKNTIRFVASRPKAETLIHELNVVLQNIQTRHFPVSLIGGEHEIIDAVLLEEVGRISNTYVNQSHSTKRISVTWLESRGHKEKDAEYDVEDMRHVVFRLLLAALKPEPALLKLYAPEQAEALSNSQLIVDEYNKDKWSWKDKLGRWARYTNPPRTQDAEKHLSDEQSPLLDSPVRLSLSESPASNTEEDGYATQSSSEVSGIVKFLKESNIAGLKDAEIEIQEPSETFPHQPVRWSPELHTTTTAVFGHVLLDAMGLPAKALIPELAETKSLNDYYRIFSPIVPHPMQLATLHGRQQQQQQQQQLDDDKQGGNTTPPPFSVEHTIVIRFAPTPSSKLLEPCLPGPLLELRLALTDSDEPQITGIHSMRAITETHVHDVMMPASPVDIRIQQQRVATLQGEPDELAFWQPLESFLARARLDISRGKLEMPAQQRFQIPARLFYRSHPSHYESMKPVRAQVSARMSRISDRANKHIQSRIPADKNEPISILYDFMGLELHRAVRVPYEGHTLTYTSIEAGQGGGRRAELALLPTPSSGEFFTAEPGEMSRKQEEQTSLNDFLDLIYKTARTAKFWSGFAG
ncbi:hypothetical protein PG995_007146 [Apiospora arundinis]